MKLRDVARKLLDAPKMRGPTRALLLGYIVIVRLYGWQGFGSITDRTIRDVKSRLKVLGIDPMDVDIDPP